MDFEQLKKTAEQNGAQFDCVDGVPHSVNPPETLFGFTYWSHCIPPFKPKKCLILGAKGGTIVKLMERVWGKIESVTVDSKSGPDVFMVSDAMKFVYNYPEKFDCVIVDLWDGGLISPLVDNSDFINGLSDICSGYLCINYSPNTTESYTSHLAKYSEHFEKCRADVVFNNVVEWWVKK